MNFVILFVVLVICLTLADRNPGNYVEGVKDIKPENFYDTLRLSPTFLLVEFYNPRCPWCRKFVDELEVLSTLLSRHSRVIRLAKMDITLPASHHIKMDQKIRGTPSVALYTRGKTAPLLMQGSPLWRNYWRIDAETRLERILKFVNENCQLTLLISDLDEEDEVEDGSAHPLAIDMAADPEHMTPEQLAARKQSLIAKLTGKGRVQFGPDVMTAEEEEEIRQRQQKEIGTEGWSLHDLGEFTGRAQSILKKPFAEPKLPTTQQQQQEETKQRKKKSRREKFQERDQQIQEAWIAAERAAEGVVVFNSEVGIGGDATGTDIDAVLGALSKDLGEEGNTQQQPHSEGEGVINEDLWDGIETALSELEPPIDDSSLQDDEKQKGLSTEDEQQEGSVTAPAEDGQQPQQHTNSTHDTVGQGQEGGSTERGGTEEDPTVAATERESLESTPMDQSEQKGQDDVQLQRGPEEEQHIPTNPENNNPQQPSEDLPEAKEEQPGQDTADQGPEL